MSPRHPAAGRLAAAAGALALATLLAGAVAGGQFAGGQFAGGQFAGGHGAARRQARAFAAAPTTSQQTVPATDPTAVPAVASGPDVSSPTYAMLQELFDRIQGQEDRIVGVQGRIADAEDRNTNLIGLMIGVGLVEAVLFGVILLITLRASRAAIGAARALPVLERAYVFLANGPSIDRPAELGASPAVRARFNVGLINHGRTPAVVRWINLNQQYLAGLPEGIYEDHERHGAGIVLGAGETHLVHGRETMIPRTDWQRAADGDGGIYLHGRIVYGDIFGAQHETYFCWRYDVAAGAFAVVESEGLNRHD